MTSEPIDDSASRPFDRRRLIKAGGGALALGAGIARVGRAAAHATADEAASATGDHEAVDAQASDRLAGLTALSQALTGGGRIGQERAAQLLGLIDADPTRVAALDRLLANRDAGDAGAVPTPGDVTERALIADILTFWYQGIYGGKTVEGYGQAWFSLHAWQAASYTFAPSICKAFGGWSGPPPNAAATLTGAGAVR